MQYGGDLPDPYKKAAKDRRDGLESIYLEFVDSYNSLVQVKKVSNRSQNEAIKFLNKGDIDSFLKRFEIARDFRKDYVGEPSPAWMQAPERAYNWDWNWLQQRDRLKGLSTDQWLKRSEAMRESYVMLIRRHYPLDSAIELDKAGALLDLLIEGDVYVYCEEFKKMATRCTEDHAMQPIRCQGVLWGYGPAIDAQMSAAANAQLDEDCRKTTASPGDTSGKGGSGSDAQEASAQLPRGCRESSSQNCEALAAQQRCDVGRSDDREGLSSPADEEGEEYDEHEEAGQSSSASTISCASSFSRTKKAGDPEHDSEDEAPSADRQETPNDTCASLPGPQEPSDCRSAMDISEDEQKSPEPSDCSASTSESMEDAGTTAQEAGTASHVPGLSDTRVEGGVRSVDFAWQRPDPGSHTDKAIEPSIETANAKEDHSDEDWRSSVSTATMDISEDQQEPGGDLPDSHNEAAAKRRAELERRYLDFRESYNSHVQKDEIKEKSKNSADSFLKDGDIDAFLRRFKYMRDRRWGSVAEPPPDWMKAPEEADKWDRTWLQQRKGLKELGRTRWWETSESTRKSYLRLIRRHYQLDTASDLEQAAELLDCLLSNKVSSNKVSSFTDKFQLMVGARCKENHRTKPFSCRNLNYWNDAAAEAMDAQLANCFNTDDEWSESDTQEANEQLPRECESMAPSADRQETPRSSQEPSDWGNAMDISEDEQKPLDCSASTSESMEDAGTTVQEAGVAASVSGLSDTRVEGGVPSVDFAWQKPAEDPGSETDKVPLNRRLAQVPLVLGQPDPPQLKTFRLKVQNAAGGTTLPRLRSANVKEVGSIQRKRGLEDESNTDASAPPKRRQRELLLPNPEKEEEEKEKHRNVAKRIAEDSEMLQRATHFLRLPKPQVESYYILLIGMIRNGRLTFGELPESDQRILSPFLVQAPVVPVVAQEVDFASSDRRDLEQWYALCGPWHPLYCWQPSFEEFAKGLRGNERGSAPYSQELRAVIEKFRMVVQAEVPYLLDDVRKILQDAEKKKKKAQDRQVRGTQRTEFQFRVSRPEAKTKRHEQRLANAAIAANRNAEKGNAQVLERSLRTSMLLAVRLLDQAEARREALLRVIPDGAETAHWDGMAADLKDLRDAFDDNQPLPPTNERDKRIWELDEKVPALLDLNDKVTRRADAVHHEYVAQVATLGGALAQSQEACGKSEKDLSSARTDLSEVEGKLAAAQGELSAMLDFIASLSQETHPSVETIFSGLLRTGLFCKPVVASFHSLLCGCDAWVACEANAARCGEVFRQLHEQAVQPEDGLLEQTESIARTVAHIVDSKQTIENLQSENRKARAEAEHHQRLHEAQREALELYDRLHHAIRETSRATRKKPLTDTSGLKRQIELDLDALEKSRKKAQDNLSAWEAENKHLKTVNTSILAAQSTCEAEAEQLSKKLADRTESTLKLAHICISQISARQGHAEERPQQKLWDEQIAEVQRAISTLHDDQTQCWQDRQQKLTESVEELCRLDKEIPQYQNLTAGREAAERARLDVICWLLHPDGRDMGPVLREGGLWCQLMLDRVGHKESLSNLDPPVVRETEQYIFYKPVFERITKVQADAACTKRVLSRTESLESSPDTHHVKTAEEDTGVARLQEAPETMQEQFLKEVRWLPIREVKRIALLEFLLQQQTSQPEEVLTALEKAQLQYRPLVACLHWALCSCNNMETDTALCSDFYTELMAQSQEPPLSYAKDEVRAYGRCFSALGKLKDEIQRLKDAEDDYLEGLRSLQDEKTKLQQGIAQAAADLAHVKAELANAEAASTENQAQRKAAETELVEAGEERTGLRARLETVEKGYQEDLKRHREASDKCLAEVEATARAKLADVGSKMEASERERQKLAEDNLALQQSIATLDIEIAGLRQRLLSEEIPACVFPVDETAEPIEPYEELEERLRRELSSATSSRNKALERIEELERSLTKAADELKRKAAKYHEAEALWQMQKEHAIGRFSELERDLEAEKQQTVKLESARGALEAKVQELAHKLKEARKLATALNLARSYLRTAQEQLSKEEHAKTKLEARVKELEAGWQAGDLAEFQKRYTGRLLEITSPLKRDLQKSKEDCNTLMKLLKRFQEERGTAVQAAQIAKKNIATLERELQRAKNGLHARATLVRSHSMPVPAEMPSGLDGHHSIHAEIRRLREEGQDNEMIFNIVVQQVATERLGEELTLVKAHLVQTQRRLLFSEEARRTLDAKVMAAEKGKHGSIQMLQKCQEENERLKAGLRDVVPSLQRLDDLMSGAKASAASDWPCTRETKPTVEAVASAVQHHVQIIEGLHSDVKASLTHGLSKAVLTLQANADAYANLVSSLASLVDIFQQCQTWLAKTSKPREDYLSAPQDVCSAVEVLDQPADPASLLSRFESQDTATKLGRQCICLVIQCAHSWLGTPAASLPPESDPIAAVDNLPAEQAHVLDEYVTPQAEDTTPCFGVDSAEHSVAASRTASLDLVSEEKPVTGNTERPQQVKRQSEFQGAKPALHDEATQTSDSSYRDCCSALEKLRHTADRRKQRKKELKITLNNIRACLVTVRAEFAAAEKYLLDNGESLRTNTRVLELFDGDDCSAEDINKRLDFHGAALDHRSKLLDFSSQELSGALSAVVSFAAAKETHRVDMIREMLSCTRLGVSPRDRNWEQQLRVHNMNWAEGRAALQACGIPMEGRHVPSRCKDSPLPGAYKRLFQEIELMAIKNTKLKTSQEDQALRAVSAADTTPNTGEASAEHSVVAPLPASVNLNFEVEAATEDTEQPRQAKRQSELLAARPALQDDATQMSDCSCRDCHTAMRKWDAFVTLLQDAHSKFTNANTWLVCNGKPSDVDRKVLQLFDGGGYSTKDIDGILRPFKEEYPYKQLRRTLLAMVRFATTKETQRLEIARKMLSWTTSGVFPRDGDWEQQLCNHHMQCQESVAALQACGIATEGLFTGTGSSTQPPQAYRRLIQNIALVARGNAKKMTIQKMPAVHAALDCCEIQDVKRPMDKSRRARTDGPNNSNDTSIWQPKKLRLSIPESDTIVLNNEEWGIYGVTPFGRGQKCNIMLICKSCTRNKLGEIELNFKTSEVMAMIRLLDAAEAKHVAKRIYDFCREKKQEKWLPSGVRFKTATPLRTNPSRYKVTYYGEEEEHTQRTLCLYQLYDMGQHVRAKVGPGVIHQFELEREKRKGQAPKRQNL